MAPVSDRESVGKRAVAYPAGAALLGATISAFAVLLVIPPKQTSAPVVAQPPPAPVLALPEVDRTVQRARFYEQHVDPMIAETDRRNRLAASRCLDRLHQVFVGYQRGIHPFVEDLTSLSTRMGIMRRMPGNWWHEDDRIEQYVQGKFQQHLFSEKSLTHDMTLVLNDFRDEVEANQRRMLVDVRASLDTADLPEIELEQYEPFFAEVAKRLRGYSAAQGTSSVYNALTVLVVSEAGSYAAVTLVAGLLTRFGTAAAVSAATGAGATAGAAATGAGTGTLAGPVGTAVGLGVGLVVGLVIDYWMTDQFQDEMNEHLNVYIRSLEHAILTGQVDYMEETLPQLSGGQSGLVDALPELCDGLLEAYRGRFYEQIVTGNSSS